jgi:three-Cys-motif partner protein
MGSLIAPRSTQTQVRHIILEKYLSAWGGIIINALKGRAKLAEQRRNSFKLHLVYVDCFAGVGRYSKDVGKEFLPEEEFIPGSPLIGVKVLDELKNWAKSSYGIEVTSNAILIESKSNRINELKRSIRLAELASRIRDSDDFSSMEDGEITVVHADSTTAANRLLNYTKSGYKFSFYFLDPYGPKGIPLSFVSSVITNQRHDVMINMPYQDLHKKTGLVAHSGEIDQ